MRLALKLRNIAAAAAACAILFPVPPELAAEIKLDGQAILFYTDDVGLFSATRRLSRDADPTQPAIDTRLTNQGDDVIFEPRMDVSTTVQSRYGTSTFDIRGQGFIYTEHTAFNHGTMRIQALHAFTPETRVRLRYDYAPDQLLGNNEERHSGTLQLAPEILTSHIWSARFEQALTPDVEVRLLTRYGLRRYNENFSQRNTDFWTIGPHLDWRVNRRVMLGFSYHYERGLAEGRHQPQFEDDVSYVNHYLSADLDVELLERLTLLTAFHYERNIWTSDLVGDERRGAHEDVYLGEIILVRRFSDSMQAFIGVQRSNRKQSFETDGIKNTNVGIGVRMGF